MITYQGDALVGAPTKRQEPCLQEDLYFAGLIQRGASAFPNSPAVRSESGELFTYAGFDAAIEAMADRLAPHVAPGTVAANALASLFANWTATFALARLGAASFDATGSASLSDGRPDLVIADEDWTGAAAVPVVRVGPEAAKSPASPRCDRARARDRPIRLIFSSGTTGRRKGVAITDADLDGRLPRYLESYQVNRETRGAPMITAASGPGFSLPLAIWSAGGQVLLDERAFLDETLPDEERPNVMIGAPAVFSKLLGLAPPSFRAPPGLRVMVAGSALAPRLTCELMARFSATVHVRYGATEVSSIAYGAAPLVEAKAGVIGRVTQGSEIQIVSEQGQALPPGSVGEIRIRSPGMATAYWNDSEATLRYFRDGWFQPGDLASYSAEGELRLFGRVDGVINVNGLKLLSSDVEAFVNAWPDVSEAGVCLLMNRRGAAVLALGVVAEGDFNEGELIAAVFKRFAASPAITRFTRLPRSETGKLQVGMMRLSIATRSRGLLQEPGKAAPGRRPAGRFR